MVRTRLAVLALVGVIFGGAVVVADPQMGACVSGLERFVSEQQSCDDSAGLRCVDPAPMQCAEWADPPTGTQKKWTSNPIVGTCKADKGSEGAVPSCWYCYNDGEFADGEYCAYGFKFKNLTDCNNDEDGVDAWGFHSGICTKTTYDSK